MCDKNSLNCLINFNNKISIMIKQDFYNENNMLCPMDQINDVPKNS
jgi:hypothetical protein